MTQTTRLSACLGQLLGIFLFATITVAATPVVVDTVIYKNAAGKRIYTTQRIKSAAPKVDGMLDDVCWSEGIWSGNYTQQIPTEGEEPSAETELKILYDDENIYVAIRAHDDPDKIDRTAGRRDFINGDIVGICFDSYHDQRTGFEFDLTAAGSKIDLILMNHGWDTSWDAVWDGKVAMEDSAWTAEFRIPLSQLRYSNKPKQVWGLHAWRWINRNMEEDQWALIPRDTPARMANIGELHGIQNLPKNRRFELLPYVRGQLHTFEKEKGNPFAGGSDTGFAAGFDGKLGISSDFTMDFTVNPDFGQVEADPSVLNLTVFETFYEEKRPFFLEGKNIYDFDFEEDLLFYSRRIGHRPSYTPELDHNEYAKAPDNTAILGATKVSGKSKNGLSIGILESVTAKENAEIASSDGRSEKTVEPLSNYFVTRIQKDYNNSNTILGMIFTAAHRVIDQDHLDFLSKSAYTGGFDFRHYWKNKTYYLDAKGTFSSISGDPQAILALQTSSARYFQRPDAPHVFIDSTATGLNGTGGMVEIGKGGNGHWRWDLNANFRTPGLDFNDLGYLMQADAIELQGGIAYVQHAPQGLFRSYAIETGIENNWDMNRSFLGSRYWFEVNGEFQNKWQFFANAYYETDQIDTRLLRGGPAVRVKGWLHNMYRITSDYSKKFSVGAMLHGHYHYDGISKTFSTAPFINWKITNTLQLSSEIEYMNTRTALQYINVIDFQTDKRYIMGELDRETLGMTLRLDFALTPELTIQYYGNPYVSVGDYHNIKRITNPRADHYKDLYHIFTSEEIRYDAQNNQYHIDETGDGYIDYSIDNPDFTFWEFRSNFVLRWEYKLGSTFYFVWTHGRSAWDNIGGSSLHDGFDSMDRAIPDNIYLVKFNYWFSL
ncbi:carbohydrate binding family 9 domain-containing protein [candidate division KSB1 bacterium]|nr:carbohydrate binding family 9 domain-containing protein [candidate division KSB1 bacterium]